jgi:hypothetical protein
MIITYKDWHEMLPFALHAYCTTIKMSKRATPYSLVYGIEVVLPLKVEISPLKIVVESELEEANWVKMRYK